MLGFIRGSGEVGYYSAAVKVKQILVSVVTSLGAVLLPRLSYYYEQRNMEEFERLTQKALNFVFILSLPMVIYFILVSKYAILFLSGESFLPAVLPMQLIMPAVLFIGLSNLMGIQILVPTNREKLVIYSTIVGAVVDIHVNIFAIPSMGASGAAIVGTIAECSVAVVQFYFLKEFILPIFKMVHFKKIVSSLLVATIATVGLLMFLQVNDFWTLVVSASIYFALYGIVLFLQKEEFIIELWKMVSFKIRK